MDEIAAVFYEKIYQQRKQEGGSLIEVHDPNVSLAADHARPGKALDIGCGLGRNTFFLARRGFKVKAVDISPTAIEIVREHAARKRLKVQADAANILHELLPDQYNVIVNNYVLDHFSKKEACWIVKRMQEKTRKDGIITIATFTDEAQEIGIESLYERHYFNPNELLRLFSNEWKVLSFRVIKVRPREWDVLYPAVELIVKRVRISS